MPRCRSKRTPKKGLGLKRGCYWLSKDFIDYAWRVFWHNAPNLGTDAAYEADAISGAEVWKDLRIRDRRALGMCFKHFALTGVLPLKLLNPKNKGNFKYRRMPLDQSPIVH